MKKQILSGVLVGGLFGALTAWGAMSDALPAGGLVTLAGAFDGIMAGLGIGWLIGINIAEGAIDEAGEELAHVGRPGHMVTAH
ncbi:MAG: hypothetical protein HY268_23590 [Deltaproteobacteria bacterium]|nr:hypothetical protein [Deltaproteobacteria bacterium]